MISFLKGEVKFIGTNSIALLVGPIAYEINIPVSKVELDFSEQKELEVYTHMVVRENDISLWGFLDLASLKLFKELLNVSGVGPKTAQSLIYQVGAEEVYNAIVNDSFSTLKISGIGVKTAQKIVIELKEKLFNKFEFDSTKLSSKEDNLILLEAKEALISLGYREKDVLEVVKAIDLGSVKSAQEVIKLILKKI